MLIIRHYVREIIVSR